jgi:hypothetical protein
MIFPTRRISFDAVIARARELDAQLSLLARAHAAAEITPDPSWYGFDSIHIRRSARDVAWATFLSSGAPSGGNAGRTITGRERLARPDRRAVAHSRQEERRWFGREEHRAQPSAILADGTTIALY